MALKGMAVVRYTAVTLGDVSRRFSGVLSVTGRIGGREGSFVLEDRGTGSTQETNAHWIVVPGSATGEPAGLTCDGGWHWEVDRKDEAYTLLRAREGLIGEPRTHHDTSDERGQRGSGSSLWRLDMRLTISSGSAMAVSPAEVVHQGMV